ncbi:hypothetical protein GCM10010219_59880 [Streptomyces netropsis]|nr:hypothetical protein GCM10010219_59880 [Streptomyces netropsis]
MALAVAELQAAAAPVLSHPDARVAAATGRLMEAVREVENPERLRAVLEAFGQAVRDSLTAPRRRLWRRWRRTPPSSASGNIGTAVGAGNDHG